MVVFRIRTTFCVSWAATLRVVIVHIVVFSVLNSLKFERSILVASVLNVGDRVLFDRYWTSPEVFRVVVIPNGVCIVNRIVHYRKRLIRLILFLLFVIHPHFVNQLVKTIRYSLTSFGTCSNMMTSRQQCILFYFFDIVCILFHKRLVGQNGKLASNFTLVKHLLAFRKLVILICNNHDRSLCAQIVSEISNLLLNSLNTVICRLGSVIYNERPMSSSIVSLV